MIELKKGTTGIWQTTLTERVTLAPPYYYLIDIRYRMGGYSTAFVVPAASDLSQYPQRINKFAINVDAAFGNLPAGQYSYNVYEQSSATNLVPANAGRLLETGLLVLTDNPDYQFKTYKPANNFIVPK